MAATSSDPLERLEALLVAGRRAPTRRMLIIVNPYATTVSDRLKNLVVYVLRGSYEVDASVVERVDAHPRLKARFGEWYYTVTGVNTFTRRYLVHPPRLEAALEDERVAGVSAIIQNAAPYTYFGSQPVEMAEGASLSS